MSSKLRFAFAVTIPLLTTGCANLSGWKPVQKPTAPVVRPKAWWAGDGVRGAPSLVISIPEQRAFFFKGKRLVGESVISSGRKGFETPPGRYRIIQKDK